MAVTSKMNRMVLLYMLILYMVSLPTSLPKYLLVETAGNQRGDDYQGSPPLLPQPGDGQYYSISPDLDAAVGRRGGGGRLTVGH